MSQQATPPMPPAPRSPGKKPVWKRWWFWVAAVLVISVIGSAAGLGADEKDQIASSQSPAVQTESPGPSQSENEPPEVPTETPQPTEPPAPAEPKPINLRGSGKTATKPFKLEGGFTTFHVKASGGSNVIVYLVNERGKKVELLVNFIGTYDGVSGIGAKPGTYLLDIDAPSSWTAVIEQPRPTSGKTPPQTYSGSGSDVAGPVTLDGLTRVVMKYQGRSNFIVYLVNDRGVQVELLANEIGSFRGSTALPGDGGIYWLTVDTEGKWSIKVQ